MRGVGQPFSISTHLTVIGLGNREPGWKTALGRDGVKLPKLGWLPRFTDIEEVVRTAWEWHEAHPDGYDG